MTVRKLTYLVPAAIVGATLGHLDSQPIKMPTPASPAERSAMFQKRAEAALSETLAEYRARERAIRISSPH